VGMGMTEQGLGLSSKQGTVLDRLGDAEETIRRVLRDADEMLRLHLTARFRAGGACGSIVYHRMTSSCWLWLRRDTGE
jgi:hypothetical protein